MNPQTLLLIDDDPNYRQTLYEQLSAQGYHIICDTFPVHLNVNGDLPNAALLVDSADVDSVALCEQLLTQPGTQELPIIVLTEDVEKLDALFAAGAADCLLRPVNMRLLQHRLSQHLGWQSLRRKSEKIQQRHRIISETVSDYAYSYIVNEDGSLEKDWSTQAFHDITGYTFEEVDKDGWERLIHPDDKRAGLERFARLLNGETDITEFRIKTKAGETRWLRDHGHPVIDSESGRVVHIYGAAQDITVRKHNEEMLRHQALELQARNEELDAFAHTVAHDLKNPIASMMGFTSLVINYYDRMPDNKIREHLDLIMESGYKLKQIINALLLLASVNKMDEAHMEPLFTNDIVESARKRLNAMIEETGATLHAPTEWPDAEGYGPWVEEVWMNYISNAMKYGGDPPVVTLGADKQPDGMVRFWVRDNGNGLTPDEQARVFTPFTRLNQVKIEGHGLGLSVVQRIVRKLRGEVGVESKLGQGSTFSFTLPSA